MAKKLPEGEDVCLQEVGREVTRRAVLVDAEKTEKKNGMTHACSRCQRRANGEEEDKEGKHLGHRMRMSRVGNTGGDQA